MLYTCVLLVADEYDPRVEDPSFRRYMTMVRRQSLMVQQRMVWAYDLRGVLKRDTQAQTDARLKLHAEMFGCSTLPLTAQMLSWKMLESYCSLHTWLTVTT
jgi:hypothetical protein